MCFSAGFPRGRPGDRDSYAGSLCGRSFQKIPVGEWGIETGKGDSQEACVVMQIHTVLTGA